MPRSATSPADYIFEPLLGMEGVEESWTVGVFEDANPDADPGDLSAVIDWGDGTQSEGIIAPTGGSATGSGTDFMVIGTHLYEEASMPLAPYVIGVLVQDSGGASTVIDGADNMVSKADILDAPNPGAGDQPRGRGRHRRHAHSQRRDGRHVH